MRDVPEDISAAADSFVERLFRPHSATAGNAIRLFTEAIVAERERCASGLEQKALLMRGSVTGDMMARIFEAEAAAIRNAHTFK